MLERHECEYSGINRHPEMDEQAQQLMHRSTDRVRHILFNIAMGKIETLDARFQKYAEFVQQVLAKTDKQGPKGMKCVLQSEEISMSKKTFAKLLKS